MQSLSTDVAIIGAGATGLTAAFALQNAGARVLVVEARDRVGGRLWTREVNGEVFEMGGQWFSPDQSALIETLDALGLKSFSRYRSGQDLYVAPTGETRSFSGNVVPTGAETEHEIERLTLLLDELAADIDASAPWEHPHANQYDSVSFRTWLEQQSSDREAIDNVSMFIAEAMLTKPAHAFSLLQALHMAATAGSFSNLVDPDIVLDKRVIGGLQQVPIKLADLVGPECLRLGQSVRSISWENDTAQVVTESLQISARRVLIAIPPNLYDTIAYNPALPALRQQMHQHHSLGMVIKVQASYPSPFWRDAGLSGTAFSPYQVVHEAYDNSGHEDEHGMLVGFVAGPKADELVALSADERRRLVLQSLANYFGSEAMDPLAYVESDWHADQWTRGAYGTSFGIGGTTRYGAMPLEPVGPLFFGSSDLAAEGYLHVDGAIRVGRRLAEEIALSLSPAHGAPTRGGAAAGHE